MTEGSKREIREHWEHVQEASGQPFDWSFFDREGFVYDTEPVSRTTVVIRRQGLDEALNFLRRAHTAFYAQNRDVTNAEVLADLASEAGHDRAQFLEALQSEDLWQETWTDFAISQRAGVRGFPFLIAGTDEQAQYSILTHGFQQVERVPLTLEQWLEMAQQSASALPRDAQGQASRPTTTRRSFAADPRSPRWRQTPRRGRSAGRPRNARQARLIDPPTGR